MATIESILEPQPENGNGIPVLIFYSVSMKVYVEFYVMVNAISDTTSVGHSRKFGGCQFLDSVNKRLGVVKSQSFKGSHLTV